MDETAAGDDVTEQYVDLQSQLTNLEATRARIQDFLKDAKNKDIAARFLRASFKGWEFCRDNVAECVQIVLKNDASGVMKADAQKWQMDEINKLIWPAPECAKDKGIGYMCPDQFKQTADIAQKFGVIAKAPDDKAYTHEIWEMAKK